MTRAKSSAGRAIVKLAFIGIIGYMATTVLGGFLLAIYEGNPTLGEEPRPLFNHCMRKLTVLEDEFDARMVQSQLTVANGKVDATWPVWLDDTLSPTLSTLRTACVLDTHPELTLVVENLSSRAKQASERHASMNANQQSAHSELQALGRRAP